jgi:hypothetical protein
LEVFLWSAVTFQPSAKSCSTRLTPRKPVAPVMNAVFKSDDGLSQRAANSDAQL